MCKAILIRQRYLCGEMPVMAEIDGRTLYTWIQSNREKNVIEFSIFYILIREGIRFG